jgi:hypothetical protein
VQSRASRVARGWIAGSFATGVAATSHGVADGSAPSVLAIGTALVFAGVLGTFAIGRRASLPRMTLVVAGSQLAFHLVFSALTPGTATAGGHHGSAMLLPSAAGQGTDASMWTMWIGHTLALLLTLGFLREAELALFSLLREVVLDTVGIVLRLPAIATPPLAPRIRSANSPRHPVLFLLQFVVSHRGPPLAAPAL